MWKETRQWIAIIFVNFTPQNLTLYAQYLRHMMNEEDRSESDEEIVKDYSADTYVQVIHETKYDLVVISVDSHIQVINCMKKADYQRSKH